MNRSALILLLGCVLFLAACGGNSQDATSGDGSKKQTKKEAPKQKQTKPKAKSAPKKQTVMGKQPAKPQGVYAYASADTQTMIIVRPERIVKHPLFVLLPKNLIEQFIPLDADQLGGIKQATAFAPTFATSQTDLQLFAFFGTKVGVTGDDQLVVANAKFVQAPLRLIKVGSE